MQSTPFLVGDKELSLRYENKQQQDIKNNSPKMFGLTRIDTRGNEQPITKFSSPMEILNHLGDTDIQTYLIQKGLEWQGSCAEKITESKAGNLRQEYLEAGEPDAGEKYEAFQMLLMDALSLNVIGASGKKLKEKGEAAQEKLREASRKQP